MSEYQITYKITEKTLSMSVPKLKSDQTKIQEILTTMKKFGNIVEIPKDDSFFSFHPIIRFYLKIRTTIFEFQFCDNRFQIRGSKANDFREFEKRLREKEYLEFANFQSGFTLDKLKSWLYAFKNYL